jgi:chromosome segregation ATPase
MNAREQTPLQDLLALPGTDERAEVDSFHRDISESIEKLVDSLKQTRHVQGLAQKLKDKGGWSTLWGTVSGSNDKDLASMVAELGGSVETTQIVLTTVLRMQTRKDHLLRGLHTALVEKYEALKLDTTTLDENQRAAAMYFIAELRDLVFAKIEQKEMVDRHEERILELDEFVEHARDSEQEVGDRLHSLDEVTQGLNAVKEVLAEQVAEHGERLSNVEDEGNRHLAQTRQAFDLIDGAQRREVEQAARIQRLETLLSELSESHTRASLDLEAAMAAVRKLEAQRRGEAALGARLLRHSPGLLALLVAIGVAVAAHLG